MVPRPHKPPQPSELEKTAPTHKILRTEKGTAARMTFIFTEQKFTWPERQKPGAEHPASRASHTCTTAKGHQWGKGTAPGSSSMPASSTSCKPHSSASQRLEAFVYTHYYQLRSQELNLKPKHQLSTTDPTALLQAHGSKKPPPQKTRGPSPPGFGGGHSCPASSKHCTSALLSPTAMPGTPQHSPAVCMQ